MQEAGDALSKLQTVTLSVTVCILLRFFLFIHFIKIELGPSFAKILLNLSITFIWLLSFQKALFLLTLYYLGMWLLFKKHNFYR